MPYELRRAAPQLEVAVLKTLPGSDGTSDMQQLSRVPKWVWFIIAALVWSVLLIVLACTVHDRGTASDPAMLFHSYTLVQDVGPGILVLVAAPLVITLVLARVLYLKSTRRSFRAERAALWVASLSLLVCLPGLIVQGLWVLPAPAFIVAAAATAPLAAKDSLGVDGMRSDAR